MSAGRRAAAWTAAGLAAAAAIHGRAALTVPFGWYKDDCLHVLLGLRLLRDGYPYADPLPGLPALLALPAALAAPRWRLLSLLPLAAAALLVACAWRLGRRLLSAERGAGAALLVAATPVLLLHSGAVMPDVFAAAFGLLALERLGAGRPVQSGAAAAAASLFHPVGAVYPLALAFARPRLGAAALAPLGLWLLGRRLLVGTATPLLATLPERVSQPRLPALIELGRGLLFPSASAAAALLLALAALAAAAAGALALRRRRDPEVRALLAAAAGTLLLLFAWGVPDPRYVVFLAAPVWLLASAALPPSAASTPLAFALAAVLAAGPARMVFSAPLADAIAWPQTMAWFAERSASGDKVESMLAPPVRLLAGREAFEPLPGAATRDGWLAGLFGRGAAFVHLDAEPRWGGAAPALAATLAGRRAWAAAAKPWLTPVFESPEEGSVIYSVRHPAPERFLAACRAYAEGAAAAGAGREGLGAAAFHEAVRLEPRLGAAWAALAVIEKDPRRRRELAARAVAVDPTLPVRLLPRD